MDIIIKDLNKSYDGKKALSHLNMILRENTVNCIMGPSGEGKTTLLRILMGLEEADSGSIRGLEGKRPSAVFQEDLLCENLSPVSNIRLVLPGAGGFRAAGRPAGHGVQSFQTLAGHGFQAVRRCILEALDAVGLSGCAGQPVRELSGGMRRRVSILRALFAEYDILYMDEPFKGLDQETKQIVMEYVRHNIEGKTAILVTHDEAEALYLAGSAGKILKL